MRLLTDLDFSLEDTAVCIGKFDGLHRGHRTLLREAEKSGLPIVMITFLFSGNKGIYSYEEKQFLAGELGIDFLVVIPATREFLQMSAEEFISDILVKRCHAKKVVVGADFCFGYKRRGNAETLQAAGKEYGFKVCVMEKLRWEGDVVSSTRIRRLLEDGRMEQVNFLLETPYFIKGTVAEGNRIGRTMSVPTANIRPSVEKVLPPFGVYAVHVLAGKKRYGGVCNLGVKPTIPGKNPVGAEVWLFDYSGNLYGEDIVLYLHAYQRPERKFETIENLHEQILYDTEQAKEILARLGKNKEGKICF